MCEQEIKEYTDTDILDWWLDHCNEYILLGVEYHHWYIRDNPHHLDSSKIEFKQGLTKREAVMNAMNALSVQQPVACAYCHRRY